MNTIKLNTIGERPIKKGGGGGNKYTYYDISGLSEEDKPKAMDYAYVAKEIDGGSIYYDCMGMKYRNNYTSGIIAIGVDFSARVGGPDGLFTIAETSEGLFDNLPRITEEEFYKIPTQFTFYDGETTKTYFYNEGMTWDEWIDSPYNDGNFSVRDAYLDEGLLPYVDYDGNIVQMDGDYVKPHMPIQNKLEYAVPAGGVIC